MAERFGEPRAVAVGAGAGVGGAAAREQNGRRAEHLAQVRLDAGGSAVFHADRADRARTTGTPSSLSRRASASAMSCALSETGTRGSRAPP